MAKRKVYSAEQIIIKLREAEVLLGHGIDRDVEKTVQYNQTTQRTGISPPPAPAAIYVQTQLAGLTL